MSLARNALYDRIDLIGRQHEVSGDGGFAATGRLETDPSRQSQGAGRSQRRSGHLDRVAPRHTKLIDAAIGLAFDADDLIEARSIEIDGGRRSCRHRRAQGGLAFRQCGSNGGRQFDRVAAKQNA